MKVYGWFELNKVSWSISCAKVDENKIRNVFDGKVTLKNGIEGTWFTTFSQAKIEAKKILADSIKWRKEAIKFFNISKKRHIAGHIDLF